MIDKIIVFTGIPKETAGDFNRWAEGMRSEFKCFEVKSVDMCTYEDREDNILRNALTVWYKREED